jgi:hypothetical protein
MTEWKSLAICGAKTVKTIASTVKTLATPHAFLGMVDLPWRRPSAPRNGTETMTAGRRLPLVATPPAPKHAQPPSGGYAGAKAVMSVSAARSQSLSHAH